MHGQTKWIIGLGSSIALLLIAAPIYYYVKDFHDLSRSSDPAVWGTFGDFFGGVLNPIISLLTLIVTIIIAVNISRIERRNHEESVHNTVKPLFTIANEQFFSSDTSRNGITIERDYYDYFVPQKPAGPYDYLTKHFYFKLYNKGLGIANQVKVTFKIDLDELKELLVIDDPKIKIKVGDIEFDEDKRKFITLSINSDQFNYQGWSKIPEEDRVWLGVIDIKEEEKVAIPNQIISLFNLYNLIRRLKDDDYGFPTIFVKFDYKNIHDKALNSEFKIALLHVHDYPNFSVFKLLQEQV